MVLSVTLYGSKMRVNKETEPEIKFLKLGSWDIVKRWGYKTTKCLQNGEINNWCRKKKLSSSNYVRNFLILQLSKAK